MMDKRSLNDPLHITKVKRHLLVDLWMFRFKFTRDFLEIVPRYFDAEVMWDMDINIEHQEF